MPDGGGAVAARQGEPAAEPGESGWSAGPLGQERLGRAVVAPVEREPDADRAGVGVGRRERGEGRLGLVAAAELAEVLGQGQPRPAVVGVGLDVPPQDRRRAPSAPRSMFRVRHQWKTFVEGQRDELARGRRNSAFSSRRRSCMP